MSKVAFGSPTRSKISNKLICKKSSFQNNLKHNLNLKITENEFVMNCNLKVSLTEEKLKRVRAENFRALN